MRAPLDHISDTRARIWLDAHRRPALRPFGPVQMIFCFLLAGVSASGVTGLALWRARLVGHWRVARKAISELDGRWRDYARNG
ncbi:hypothetical protein [Nonomuraea sp. NPDC049709]|uniref:hypothetical protein n=1 Tax=Nonomuraea sp. NPDC049709 TaxID=3154736 RepID=UPI00342A08F9